MDVTEGLTVVSFHDVTYHVKVRSGEGCRGPKTDKTILHPMSGVCKPGLNAIMGPTGSGKTSLLDILAGRKDPRGLQGSVLVNGKPQPKNFKCVTGYVVQDDVVMGTLSVRENLMFSANLRFPKTVKREEKVEKVNSVLDELGLTYCADTKVGTAFFRGVSGGERKRTNIGMELIIRPSILFLDEPTTGLDSNTAYSVLKLLKKLAENGRTIILSIHQPRYSIYKLFDTLFLLAKGHLVYEGPCQETLSYFSSIGYECEAHNNPADFFLDVLNGKEEVTGDSGRHEAAEGTSSLSKKTSIMGRNNGVSIEMQDLNQEDKDDETFALELKEKFFRSEQHKNMNIEISKASSVSLQDDGDEELQVYDYQTGFGTQLWYLCGRAVTNILRNPQTSVFQLIVTMFLALVVGVLYFDVDCTSNGFQNRLGVFFFVSMNNVFSNLGSTELFIAERKIFLHENSSGFYRVSSYFFSKIICDLIPLRIIPVAMFCLVSYFMIGLKAEIEAFLVYFITLFLLAMSGSGIGFFWSATVNIFAIANLFLAMTFVTMLIFGGLLVNVESIWVGIRWLQYFSIFRYCLNALYINELYDETYCAATALNLTAKCDDCLDNPVWPKIDATEFLNNNGIYYAEPWDLWQNHFALFMLTIGFLFFAYVQLRRIPKFH